MIHVKLKFAGGLPCLANGIDITLAKSPKLIPHANFQGLATVEYAYKIKT